MEILIEKSKLAEQDVQEQQAKSVERHEKEVENQFSRFGVSKILITEKGKLP